VKVVNALRLKIIFHTHMATKKKAKKAAKKTGKKKAAKKKHR
jgi:hypothetical protein